MAKRGTRRRNVVDCVPQIPVTRFTVVQHACFEVRLRATSSLDVLEEYAYSITSPDGTVIDYHRTVCQSRVAFEHVYETS